MGIVGLTQAYTGILLGRCWVIIQERFEMYRSQTRYPYAAIGYESFGLIGRVVVSILIDVSLIGLGVAFLLIASANINILLQSQHFGVCSILPIVTLALCPLLWFGTPKDFWPIGFAGAITTGLACVLLLICMLLETPQQDTQEINIEKTAPSFGGLILGTGLICFTMLGHTIYPTIQHDMRNPAHFSMSLVLSSLIVAVYLVPVAVVAYIVYGDNLRNKESVFDVLQPSLPQTLALLLITIHVICSFVVSLNAVFQDVEELIGIGTDFSWKRVVVRTMQIAFMLFIAASVPNFNKVLEFLSGTVLITLAMIAPPLLYIKLCSMTSPAWPERSLSTFGYIKMHLIIVGSTVLGVAITVSNLKSVDSSTNEFITLSSPCYLPS